MDDLGHACQIAGEERLMAIADAEILAEDGIEVEPYPACAPWCGCDTCIVREVLDAAWPVLIDGLCAAGFAPAAAWLAGHSSVSVGPIP